MRINTRICYGLRILEVLAEEFDESPGAGYISSSVIAEREKIPKRYADSLLSLLTIAGIVSARHGAAGGYALTRAPSAITVSDIFDALEGPALSARCLDKKCGCPSMRDCSGRQIWKTLDDKIRKTLNGTTLADLQKQ